jgi:hypothetical protein
MSRCACAQVSATCALTGRRRSSFGSLRACGERFGVRVVYFSIQGTHLHLLLEAHGARALSRAMQAIAMRIAKGLNVRAQRRGPVFVDRYHAVILRSPRQVANARRYVLENHRHHTREWLPEHWRDPLASARAPLTAPATWLLREGWRVAAPDG